MQRKTNERLAKDAFTEESRYTVTTFTLSRHLDRAERYEVHLLHLLMRHALQPCLLHTLDTRVQQQMLFHLQNLNVEC